MNDCKLILDGIQEIAVLQDLESLDVVYVNEAGRLFFLDDNYKQYLCDDALKISVLKDFEAKRNNLKEIVINGVNFDVKRVIVEYNKTKYILNTFVKQHLVEESKIEREVYERILNRLSGLTLNGETYDQINKALIDIKEILKSDRVSFIKYDDGKQIYVKSFKNEDALDYVYNPIFRTVLASDYEWNRKYKDDKFIEVSIDALDEYPTVKRAMESIGVNNFVVMRWEIERLKYLLVVENVEYDMKTNKMYKTIYNFISFVINSFRYNKGLYNLGNKDTLTGLNNRNKYMVDLENKYKGTVNDVGIIYFDLDGLKETNDAFGHDAGDKLLIDMSNILMLHAEGCDLYRFGGDEFIVIASNIQKQEFEYIKDEIYKNVKFNRILCSFGSVYVNECEDLKELINEAEEEMYEYKKIHHQRLINS